MKERKMSPVHAAGTQSWAVENCRYFYPKWLEIGGFFCTHKELSCSGQWKEINAVFIRNWGVSFVFIYFRRTQLFREVGWNCRCFCMTWRAIGGLFRFFSCSINGNLCLNFNRFQSNKSIVRSTLAWHMMWKIIRDPEIINYVTIIGAANELILKANKCSSFLIYFSTWKKEAWEAIVSQMFHRNVAWSVLHW